MGPFSLLMLSVGLAMDATAVAATRGLVAPVLRWRHAVLVALFFGGFQALMPLLGWFLGARVGPLVARWDHWIIFALLAGEHTFGLFGALFAVPAASMLQTAFLFAREQIAPVAAPSTDVTEQVPS